MKKACLLVLLLAGSASADPPGVSERSRLEVAPAQHAFTQLAIDNPLGDVRIEGYDGKAVKIETHKHAPDEDTLDRLRVSLVPNPDGTVSLRTTVDGEGKRVARAAVRIDVIVMAPRNARIDASVASGKLEVEGMDAGGELDTSSGPISVKNVQGELYTHSVSGTTSLAQVFGSVDAATLASDLDLDTITGEKLVASAGKNGRIEGRRVRSRDVELTTVNGHIVFEGEAALRGRLVVSSLHGDVDVRLHHHGALIVRARGTKIDLGAPVRTQPDGWAQTTIGEDNTAASLVEMRSRYGMVQFAIVQ